MPDRSYAFCATRWRTLLLDAAGNQREDVEQAGPGARIRRHARHNAMAVARKVESEEISHNV